MRASKSPAHPHAQLIQQTRQLWGFSTESLGTMPGVLDEVRRSLGGDPQLVHYLSVPPVAFAGLTKALGEHGLAHTPCPTAAGLAGDCPAAQSAPHLPGSWPSSKLLRRPPPGQRHDWRKRRERGTTTTLNRYSAQPSTRIPT
jgi:hypothetical protein